MSSKEKPKSQQAASGAEKGKEVKIVTRHVVTPADVEKSPRLLKLLYTISIAGPISERALVALLYELKNRGVELDYNFAVIGNIISSRDALNDLTMLKYVGFVEVAQNKKLRISALGKEFLESKRSLLGEAAEGIRKLYEEVKPKIAPIDLEVEVRGRKK